jgi:hypothetical protein
MKLSEMVIRDFMSMRTYIDWIIPLRHCMRTRINVDEFSLGQGPGAKMVTRMYHWQKGD